VAERLAVAVDRPAGDREVVRDGLLRVDLDAVRRPRLDLDPPDPAGAALAQVDRVGVGDDHRDAHEVEVDGPVPAPAPPIVSAWAACASPP
jgi:hypothetical protein